MDESEMARTPGTLTDADIEDLAGAGELIVENFVKRNLKQACYELRASAIYYDLADAAKRYEIEPDAYILIKPRQQVVIITMEKLDMPDDVLGRILTKGKLFSIGLLPVNTYADPGFVGNLGIVFFNASVDYLKLKVGDPIAKIEFSRLVRPVRRPYHGQHGYQTNIWPIPSEMTMDAAEIAADERIFPVDRELRLSYGNEVADVVGKIRNYYRALMIMTCGYFAVLFVLIALVAKEYAISVGTGIGVGIATNLLTAFVVFGATSFSRRKQAWKFRS